MSTPQQPELARSRRTPAQDPDASASLLRAARAPVADPADGSVPEANAPGHHPEVEQDKPVDRFVARATELAAEPAVTDPDPEPRVPDVPEYQPVEAAEDTPSGRADYLARLAGAPWGAATKVLERLRARL